MTNSNCQYSTFAIVEQRKRISSVEILLVEGREREADDNNWRRRWDCKPISGHVLRVVTLFKHVMSYIFIQLYMLH